jgi:hypothetical protein
MDRALAQVRGRLERLAGVLHPLPHSKLPTRGQRRYIRLHWGRFRHQKSVGLWRSQLHQPEEHAAVGTRNRDLILIANRCDGEGGIDPVIGIKIGAFLEGLTS